MYAIRLTNLGTAPIPFLLIIGDPDADGREIHLQPGKCGFLKSLLNPPVNNPGIITGEGRFPRDGQPVILTWFPHPDLHLDFIELDPAHPVQDCYTPV